VKQDLLSQRVQAVALLLDLHRRAVDERQQECARVALLWRRDMLRNMREKRGYES
jgi:hypothetical protein